MSNDQDDLPDIEFDPGEQNSSVAQASVSEEANITSPELEEMTAGNNSEDASVVEKTAEDLEAVFDVPVRVSVVLGRSKMPVSSLLNMDIGTVIELDRQVGEAIDIYVNDRLVARGEIVLVEEKLGVTMTEIIKTN